MRRRGFFMMMAAWLAGRARAAVEYPRVEAGRALVFPRDHGAHPAYRTEWWYLTGWLDDAVGVQITFFRSRPGVNEAGRSPFTPRELLFAHAAIADRAVGRLVHDQRAARAGLGLAQASESTTGVAIGDWRFALDAGDRYHARIAAREFTLEIDGTPANPILLQGDAGYSRKGPAAEQASYYYSRPRIAIEGTLARGSDRRSVRGQAWLDHEWSSEYLAGAAQGWDWVGLTLEDGTDVMAFRMRTATGATYWAGGTVRDKSGARTLAPQAVRFTPIREWRSPRSDARYPVAMRLAAGDLAITIEPLMDDQELDARASVGAIYWEGAVRAGTTAGVRGRGYLELTGYWRRLAI